MFPSRTVVEPYRLNDCPTSMKLERLQQQTLVCVLFFLVWPTFIISMMPGMFDFGGTDPETDLRNRPPKQTRETYQFFFQSVHTVICLLQVSPFRGLYHGLVRFLRSWPGHCGQHCFFCGRGCDHHRTCLLLFGDDLVQR